MKSIIAGALCLGLLGGIPLKRWYEEASRPLVIVQTVLAMEPEPKEVLIEIIPTVPDVLKRIADCESGERTKDGKAVAGSGRHYDEDGNVIIGRMNKPEYGVDVGRYQINEFFHAKRAEELGLDLYDERDNEKYAMHLYEQNGTNDWLSSASCWDVVE